MVFTMSPCSHCTLSNVTQCDRLKSLVINDAKIAHFIWSHVRLTSSSFSKHSRDKTPRNNVSHSANRKVQKSFTWYWSLTKDCELWSRCHVHPYGAIWPKKYCMITVKNVTVITIPATFPNNVASFLPLQILVSFLITLHSHSIFNQMSHFRDKRNESEETFIQTSFAQIIKMTVSNFVGKLT